MRRVLLILAAASLLLGVAACGGGGSGRYEETGLDITFAIPGGFHIAHDLKISKSAGGAYGPWILALNGYSESLDSFDGGMPQLAFHGTNKPELIGTQASNGGRDDR